MLVRFPLAALGVENVSGLVLRLKIGGLDLCSRSRIVGSCALLLVGCLGFVVYVDRICGDV